MYSPIYLYNYDFTSNTFYRHWFISINVSYRYRHQRENHLLLNSRRQHQRQCPQSWSSEPSEQTVDRGSVRLQGNEEVQIWEPPTRNTDLLSRNKATGSRKRRPRYAIVEIFFRNPCKLLIAMVIIGGFIYMTLEPSASMTLKELLIAIILFIRCNVRLIPLYGPVV